MSLTEHAVNQWRRQCRRIVKIIGEVFIVRQIVVHALYPVAPFLKIALAEIGAEDILLFVAARHARHTAQARRIAVLAVNFQTILTADVVQIIDALAVLVIICRINADDGMDGLAAAVNQHGDRQL